jgi:Homeodomain-like domain
VGGVGQVRPPGCQAELTKTSCQSRLTGVERSDLAAALTTQDPVVGLRAVGALHRLAEQIEARSVHLARERGWTWEQIGDALGVSRQSVHAKYGKKER